MGAKQPQPNPNPSEIGMVPPPPPPKKFDTPVSSEEPSKDAYRIMLKTVAGALRVAIEDIKELDYDANVRVYEQICDDAYTLFQTESKLK